MTSPEPLSLIIEDHPDIAEVIAASMEAAGYRTEVIPHGATALERLKELTPAVVVLDLHLPGVDGEEILRYIRGDARLAGIRVVLISAEQQQAQLLQSMADVILLKPFSFDQLKTLASRFRPV
ncbi:MAG: response regulator [Anaerolineae bacterium]|nr:response regulator [Anaerolineae bacterium]